MKNNTEETKVYLLKALQSLPNDFALSEARFHLKTALNQIESVEAKRIKRESQQSMNNNWVVANGQLMSPDMAKKAVSQIDAMIKAENTRLEELQKKKVKNIGDEDIKPLFG